ncbi:hypothetical protein bhn_II102 (plasmid) [Butyrivibrio hungatei]|uniref:Uncharacterized protein n=1 Tax=Butyrivibrio hungatei TaxID=185008 RepID=A0A1D9P5T8_9FIRM|nr:hypothetical protein bhn_II102 [Butyrivibrio hungatei]
MTTICNIEHEQIYGIDVIHDTSTGEYYAFIGGNRISATDRSTIAFEINVLQSYPSGV